jgi:integrase/recombinase XerD
MRTSFKSRWAHELQDYESFRQIYYTSPWPHSMLRSFDAFAATHPQADLPQAITLWLKRNPHSHPSTRGYKLIAIRQFCRYRRRFDPKGFIPEWTPPATAARYHVQATILSMQQIRRVLREIDELKGPNLRRIRVRVLFLILYCTGLRLGEALRLCIADVDLKRACFRIGPSKGRTRLVPFGQDLVAEIQSWLRLRRSNGFVLTPRTPIFEREDGRAESMWNADMCLSNIFRRCGLKPARGSGRGGVRVHDLRHTFAVHRLQRWYRTGSDVNQRLPWLSAYLGHGDLTGTQRYLSATPQTLALASRRFRRSVGFNPGEP